MKFIGQRILGHTCWSDIWYNLYHWTQTDPINTTVTIEWPEQVLRMNKLSIQSLKINWTTVEPPWMVTSHHLPISVSFLIPKSVVIIYMYSGHLTIFHYNSPYYAFSRVVFVNRLHCNIKSQQNHIKSTMNNGHKAHTNSYSILRKDWHASYHLDHWYNSPFNQENMVNSITETTKPLLITFYPQPKLFWPHFLNSVSLLQRTIFGTV